MAEVIPVAVTAALSEAPKKRGKYMSAEDLIMVREVAAAGAHVAKYGETRQLFEQAANKVNQNPHISQKVTWKAVQDRYKRLQDDFDVDDAKHNNLSGVAGGEMGELCQALSQMREERDSFIKGKTADKTAKAKREEEKERMGRNVMEWTLRRKRQRDDSSEKESGNPGSTEDVKMQLNQKMAAIRQRRSHARILL